MRVFFLENENPSRDSSGGIMTYIMNLARFLRERGVEAILLGSGPLKRDTDIFSGYIPVGSRAELSNPGYLKALLKTLPKLDIAEGDIIHAQRPDMLVPAAVFLRKAKNPLVCSLHGAHDKAVFDKKGWIYGSIYRGLQYLALRKAAALIPVDLRTEEHFASRFPWVREKITTIPIGVDLETFQPDTTWTLRDRYRIGDRGKVVLFVGRLEKEKNLGFLLRAFAKVKKRVPHSQFLIVGSGREETAVMTEIQELGVEDVKLCGEMEHEHIPGFMNLADVLVLASHYEGSPNSVKEALACNTPVVSLDVGDVAEVISGIQGCYIAKRTEKDFAEKIERVLRSQAPFEARHKISRFSTDRVGERTLDVYKSLSN